MITKPAQVLWLLTWAYLFTFALVAFVSALPVSAPDIWNLGLPDVTTDWTSTTAATSVAAFLVLVHAFRSWAQKEDPYRLRGKWSSILDLVKPELQPASDNLDHIIADQNPAITNALGSVQVRDVICWIKEHAIALLAIERLGEEIQALETRRLLAEGSNQRWKDQSDQYKATVTALQKLWTRVFTWTTAKWDEDEKFDIIEHKVKSFDSWRDTIDPKKTMTPEDITKGILSLARRSQDIVNTLGLSDDASTKDILNRIQQLKDNQKVGNDDQPPRRPHWLPEWATEEWFANHPSEPMEEGKCRQVEELHVVDWLTTFAHPTELPRQASPLSPCLACRISLLSTAKRPRSWNGPPESNFSSRLTSRSTTNWEGQVFCSS
ncbi:hypothetical protein FN846DRAFT_1018495 [Sphaerosporella brunnea]|uniref:Uncharacterized protein n=1 Tax=Sphaerosporella brunnea TaxID=1250544 RepID=A0A5J5FA99_9PEZI|nr:hypothetical protein FN846DRAFT_1018495 [Sphaerosporella brunnea]